ncbi:MAG: hypothetical protein QOA57_00380 [Nitrososphaeraceae archaeon]|nr:hypothetical protein [Nitrososphaeraceae archaeon]
MTTESTLSDTMYDILKVMGKDAEFLYDTIDVYIKDAPNANKQELVDVWKKSDRLSHVNMLKDALEKEIHGG